MSENQIMPEMPASADKVTQLFNAIDRLAVISDAIDSLHSRITDEPYQKNERLKRDSDALLALLNYGSEGINNHIDYVLNRINDIEQSLF